MWHSDESEEHLRWRNDLDAERDIGLDAGIDTDSDSPLRDTDPDLWLAARSAEYVTCIPLAEVVREPEKWARWFWSCGHGWTRLLRRDYRDDRVDLDWGWLSSVAEMHRDEGYWDVPPSGDVWWEIGPISFSCEPRDMDEDDREMLAAEWQIDGQSLPDMLVPETRGHLRALCRRLGVELKEGK